MSNNKILLPFRSSCNLKCNSLESFLGAALTIFSRNDGEYKKGRKVVKNCGAKIVVLVAKHRLKLTVH